MNVKQMRLMPFIAQITKRAIVFMLALCMTVTMMPFAFLAGPAHADASETNVTTDIAEITDGGIFLDANLTTPVGDTVITPQTPIYSQININFKPDQQPNSPDMVYVYALQAGNNIHLKDVPSGILYDENGGRAGQYSISGDAVRFQYDASWLQEHSSNIKSYFTFESYITEEIAQGGGDKPISFPGGGTYTVKTDPGTSTIEKTVDMSKYNANGGYLEYSIKITSSAPINKLQLNDKFESWAYVFYDKKSFVLTDASGKTIEDVSSKMVFVDSDSAGRSASLTYGDGSSNVLPAGTYFLKYRASISEGTYLNGDSTTAKYARNNVTANVNSIDIGKAQATARIEKHILKKEPGSIEQDAKGAEYVPWTIALNNGTVKTDMSNMVYTDVLTGDHEYADLLNMKSDRHIVIKNAAGADVTQQLLDAGAIKYTDGDDRFEIHWPEGSGRQAYTVTYYTKLGEQYETYGYYNGGKIKKSTGWEYIVKAGKAGKIGFGGIHKTLDVSNITMEDLNKNGGGAYGQADWKIAVHGAMYKNPSEIQVTDTLGGITNNIWFKNPENKFVNGKADDPYIYYIKDGKEIALTKDTDYTIWVGKTSSSGGGERQQMNIKFKDTAATQAAFVGDVFIKLSTQSKGTAEPGQYKNNASINYEGTSATHVADYTVYRSRTLGKQSISDAPILNADGLWENNWRVMINGYMKDSENSWYVNEDLNKVTGENNNVITLTDTIPAGTSIKPGSVWFQVFYEYNGGDKVKVPKKTLKEQEGLNAYTLKKNDDGSTTMTVLLDRSQWGNYPTSSGSKQMLMPEVRYTTLTEQPGTYYNQTVTNEASAKVGPEDFGSAVASINVSNAPMSKEGTFIEGSGNQVSYEINVNKDGAELNGGKALSVWDELDPTMTLKTDSISVTGADGQPISGWKISGEPTTKTDGQSTSKITFSGLPDSTPLTIKYTVVITGDIGDKVDTVNSAGLNGMANTEVNASKRYTIQRVSGGATGASGQIKINKVDADEMTKPVKGAAFDLYKVDVTSGRETRINSGTTASDGSLTFKQDSITKQALQLDQLYYFVETKAPEGYITDGTKNYFILKGAQFTSVDAAAQLYLKSKVNAGDTSVKSIVPSNATTYNVMNKAPRSAEAEIQAIKKLSGRAWSSSDEFAFELLSTREDTPMPEDSTARTDGSKGKRSEVSVTSTGDQDATATFGKINYTLDDLTNPAGTDYYYGIKEVIPADATKNVNGTYTKDGISYDASEHSARVHLSLDENGDLVTSVTYYRGDSAESDNVPFFVNKYDAGETGFELDITKKVNGSKSFRGSYSFELVDNNESPEGIRYTDGEHAAGDVVNNTAVSGFGDDAGHIHVGFANIKFTAAGEYHFKIREVVPAGASEAEGKVTLNGVTYDTHEENVTVTVTDDGKGALHAKTSYDGQGNSEEGALFQNTYSAEGTAQLSLSKHISGRDWTDKDAFKFTLSADEGTPMPADGKTVTATKADRTPSFGEIKYTYEDLAGAASKDFTYTIHEERPSGDTNGMTYAADQTVTVHVADNGDGTLKVTYGKDHTNTLDAPDFVNKYESAATSAKIQVTKQVLDTDRKVVSDWEGKTFQFKLESTRTGTPMPLTTASAGLASDVVTVTDKATTAAWGEIIYTEAGEYDYTIREVLPAGIKDLDHPVLDNLVYATSVHSVHVTVTDDGKGKLTAEVTYHGGEDANIPVFYNFYTQDAVAVLHANKTLTGKELLGGEFSFALHKSNAAGELGEVHSRGTNEKDGAITSRPLNFNHDDWEAAQADGGYVYYAGQEEIPEGASQNEDGSYTLNGMTYGGNTVYYRIKLEGSEDHQISVASIEYSADLQNWTAQDVEKKQVPVFRNEFAARGRATIDASKHLDGRDWLDSDEFEFILTGEENAPIHVEAEGQMMDADMLPVVATKDQKIVDFMDLVFTQEDLKDGNTYVDDKTFTYRIHEVVSDGEKDLNSGDGTFEKDGITYAADQLVTVNVHNNGDGTLQITYGEDKTNTIENPQFINKYKTNDASAKIEVRKTLEGRSWSDIDKYVFTLTAPEGTPMPTAARTSTITINSKDAGKITKKDFFDEITYTRAGTYNYSVTEQQGSIGGITYSTAEHAVKVVVSDNGKGELSAEVFYMQDKSEPTPFVNTYRAEPVNVTLEGQKTMVNRELIGGHYSFDMYSVNEDDSMTLLGNGTVSANGKMESRTLTFDKAGTYHYAIMEHVPAEAGKVEYGAGKQATFEYKGVTYSTHVSRVTIKVTDDGQGHLLAETVYDNTDASSHADAQLTDRAAFTNTYHAKGSTNLEVTKILMGREWEAEDEFSFTLETITEGAPAPENDEVTVNGDQEIGLFKGLHFTHRDIGKTYVYKITENIPDEAEDNVLHCITYDDTAYYAHVSIADGGDGTLIIKTVYNTDAGLEEGADILRVINRYEAPTAELNKVDAETGDDLDGAKLQVIHVNAAGTEVIVDEWISVKGETHTIEDLKEGQTYVLREIVAPSGYNLAEDTTFTLDENGAIDMDETTAAVDEDGVLLVKDKKTPEKPEQPGQPGKPGKPGKGIRGWAPKTGDTSILYVWGTALAGTLVALMALIFGKKREESEERD